MTGLFLTPLSIVRVLKLLSHNNFQCIHAVVFARIWNILLSCAIDILPDVVGCSEGGMTSLCLANKVSIGQACNCTVFSQSAESAF